MKNVKNSLKVAIYSLLLIWVIFLVVPMKFGVLPRVFTMDAVLGFFLSPLFHSDLGHIVANSIPLGILLFTLCVGYPKLASRVIVFSILLGNLFVWMFSRGGCSVIGASGLIFSLIGFLLFNVFFRKDWKSLLVALVIGFFYGGALLGLFPSDDPSISWEGHLFGFLVGIYLSYATRKQIAKGNCRSSGSFFRYIYFMGV